MSETIMDIQEIQKYLPHRYPFLLLDRIIELDPGQSIVALKNVSINEAHFTGHFPQQAVMPGVLIIEALAQAGGVLAYKSSETTPEDGILYYLAGIDHARFKRVVVPGDQLHLHVSMDKVKGSIWKLKAKATVNDELACSADLMCFKNDGDAK